MMIFTEAFAQTAPATSSPLGGGMDIILLFVPMLVVFYFLIFRPQRQQVKKREEILKNIRRGDQIVLGGGIVGKVTKVVDDNEVELQIADGVKVRALRALIAEVRAKAEPVAGNNP
jgi:preprotein translocase subunit YajC